jgi:hypothetical protein
MPHFVFGRAKKIFRSPFGQKSKPNVNVMWGLANFLAMSDTDCQNRKFLSKSRKTRGKLLESNSNRKISV